jgi:hypothetical protein
MKKHMENSKEYGMALLNYAESLANLKLLPQAVQVTRSVVCHMSSCHLYSPVLTETH